MEPKIYISYHFLYPGNCEPIFLIPQANKKVRFLYAVRTDLRLTNNCEIIGVQVFSLQKPFYVVGLYSYLLRGSPSLVNGVRMIAYCASLRCSDVVS